MRNGRADKKAGVLAARTGPTAYPNLGVVFSAIGAGTHTGTITIDVCGDTIEPSGGAILVASGSGSASYTTISIAPAGQVHLEQFGQRDGN